MTPSDLQARAMIASALIIRGAVEVPSLPEDGAPVLDAAAIRLRDLTDYVYRLIAMNDPQEPE
jgi:hypothetical protein